MSTVTDTIARIGKPDRLSLYHLLEPAVLADPYPLYHGLQTEDPVHWDPFLHAWVVTSYADVLWVLQNFSAKCAPDPEQMKAIGVADMGPIADTMTRQMLFMDPPTHTRLRALASQAFTPKRVEGLRSHIQEIVDGLLDSVLRAGGMDVLEDFGNPLPAIVTAELLGLPPSESLVRRFRRDSWQFSAQSTPDPSHAADTGADESVFCRGHSKSSEESEARRDRCVVECGARWRAAER